jgi:transcriptional regulator with PAS, ATPase and Fis domain
MGSTAPGPELTALIDAAGGDEADFWHSVHDTMAEALVIISPERRIVYANARARGLLTGPLESVQGRPCVEAIDCPQCRCLCRLYETGAIDGVEVTVHTPEPRVFRKHGRLLRDAEGRVLGGVETFTDVTAEREARARGAAPVDAAGGRSGALLRGRSDGVLSLDRALRVRDYSDAMAELLGVPAEAAIGRPLAALLGVPAPEGGVEALADREFEVEVGGRRVALRFLPLRYGADELLALARPIAEAGEAEALERAHGFAGMLSVSPRMEALFALVRGVADSDAHVLIEGESGVGKELVARAIHGLGPRRDRPYFAVNCATFTGSLLLSELFGHERGAFTGAYRTQRGKLELAGDGTFLLDEIGEVPIEHQALLLRVLESRRFERVGGAEPIAFSARVLAATNCGLEESVASGAFRRDLFYRLAVVPIRVPPLRERPEDIELLVRSFLARSRGGPRRISAAALDRLRAHTWPGNVRELKNVVEYLGFVAEDEILEAHLPPALGGEAPAPRPPPPGAPSRTDDERARVLDALERAHFKRARAAELLGVDRTTLWRWIKRLGIEA